MGKHGKKNNRKSTNAPSSPHKTRQSIHLGIYTSPPEPGGSGIVPMDPNGVSGHDPGPLPLSMGVPGARAREETATSISHAIITSTSLSALAVIPTSSLPRIPAAQSSGESSMTSHGGNPVSVGSVEPASSTLSPLTSITGATLSPTDPSVLQGVGQLTQSSISSSMHPLVTVARMPREVDPPLSATASASAITPPGRHATPDHSHLFSPTSSLPLSLQTAQLRREAK
jgi:hypothetical protein